MTLRYAARTTNRSCVSWPRGDLQPDDPAARVDSADHYRAAIKRALRDGVSAWHGVALLVTAASCGGPVDGAIAGSAAPNSWPGEVDVRRAAVGAHRPARRAGASPHLLRAA